MLKLQLRTWKNNGYTAGPDLENSKKGGGFLRPSFSLLSMTLVGRYFTQLKTIVIMVKGQWYMVTGQWYMVKGQ